MRKLATALALFAAVLWSAVVWGGYALIGWTGEMLAGNVGLLVQVPELAEIIAWARPLAESLGYGAVMVVWLLGIGLIGIGLLTMNLLLGRLAPAPRQERFEQPYAAPPAPQVPPQLGPAPVTTAPTWGRNASGR